VTCCVYWVYTISSKLFFLADISGGRFRFGQIHFPWQTYSSGGRLLLEWSCIQVNKVLLLFSVKRGIWQMWLRTSVGKCIVLFIQNVIPLCTELGISWILYKQVSLVQVMVRLKFISIALTFKGTSSTVLILLHADRCRHSIQMSSICVGRLIMHTYHNPADLVLSKGFIYHREEHEK
jgi:hypothetical protein